MKDQIYGSVSTSGQNEIFELIEKFGGYGQQYAILLATLIAAAKALNISHEQLRLDLAANWPRIPAPDILVEH